MLCIDCHEQPATHKRPKVCQQCWDNRYRYNLGKHCPICDKPILNWAKACHDHSPTLRAHEYEKKFWSLVDRRSDGECWNWLGYYIKDGYGRIKIHGKNILAHRLAYTLTYGKIPDGMLVCHTCDNRACINPSHLFIGTDLDNSRDMYSKGREVILVGEDQGNSKLTSYQVMLIRQLVDSGSSYAELGRRFNVNETTIGNIAKRKTWKHLS